MRLSTTLSAFALFASVLAAAPASAAIVNFGINSNGDCTFGCVTRYQQIYSAASFGTQEIDISSVSFFAYQSGTSNASFRMTISTAAATEAAGLSTTFASNVGTDAVVFATTSFGSIVANQLISFNGTFTYDPTMGDLLIDIERVSGSSGLPYLWAANDTGYQRAYSFHSNTIADAANQGGYGNRTQFTYDLSQQVPEPSALALVAVGLLGAAAARRRTSH